MERLPSYVPHRPTPYVRSPTSVRSSIYDTNTEPYYQVTFTRDEPPMEEEDIQEAVSVVRVEDVDVSSLAV